MTDLTPIINAAIALVGALITAIVIPWLKSKTTCQKREELLVWVDIAVTAAQQLYHELDGAERKNYVLKFLQGKGYKVDDLTVDSAIEAAVHKLHQQIKEVG